MVLLESTLLVHIEKEKSLVNQRFTRGFVVPRPGIEPGWIAPLVFETSASTDSAIWAWLFHKTMQRYI